LRAYRSGKVDVLTATEVAARGLDVDDVTHVVNYECPDDDMTYVHRIGRTGRAGKAGVAVTFVDWRDMHRWKTINDALKLGKPEPEETYSTSEHLYTQLDIPREATGTLPRAMRGRVGLEAEALEDIGETGKIRSAASRRGEGPASRSSSGRGSGRSGRNERGQGAERGQGGDRGHGVQGSQGVQGGGAGGQARGGPGQPRRAAGSSDAAARDTGDGTGQSAGGASRSRRRRRTRAGRDLGTQDNQETQRKAS
jgi:superfamily II DNA/RNA helicase